MKRIIALNLAFILFLTAINAKVYNVRRYGAKGDGTTIDSPAINAAIDAASRKKGGVVLLPAGTYSCYSIHLKSNITLRFEKGATIKAAKPTESEGYDEAEPNPWDAYQDFGHSHWQNSLIWGIGLENITIEGPGVIDGSGVLSRGERQTASMANKGIALKNCRNVVIKDVSLLMLGHFALLLTGVDGLQIDNVLADTNRDAFDIDCCSDVSITNCVVNTLNDDAIVLKTSYALGYAKSTENVVISNCTVSGYDPTSVYNGTYTTNITTAPDRDGPTGRIKLGTESNGDFRNIIIRDCTFRRCRGLAFEAVDGATIDGVHVSNIDMDDICNSPIYIRLGDRMRAPEGMHASAVRNIRIEGLRATNCDSRYALLIVGLPGNRIDSVALADIDIEMRGGLTLDDVKQQRGANPFFTSHMKGYPEPASHGIQPAWGLSMQHAQNIIFKNVNIRLLNHDERDKVYLDDVERFVWE